MAFKLDFLGEKINELLAKIDTLTASDIGASTPANILTATIPTTGWVDNHITITVNGLATSGYAYDVSPAPASFQVWAEAMIWANDVTTANKITFNCNAIPTSAVTVVIKKIQVA